MVALSYLVVLRPWTRQPLSGCNPLRISPLIATGVVQKKSDQCPGNLPGVISVYAIWRSKKLRELILDAYFAPSAILHGAPVKSRQHSNVSEIIRPELLDAINKVCSRWGIFVLGELLISPRRFNDLKRRLPFVPARSLVGVLKKLEKEGLVDRRVDDSRPPGVTYSARNGDPVLSEINKLLARWGSQNNSKPHNGTHSS